MPASPPFFSLLGFVMYHQLHTVQLSSQAVYTQLVHHQAKWKRPSASMDEFKKQTCKYLINPKWTDVLTRQLWSNIVAPHLRLGFCSQYGQGQF